MDYVDLILSAATEIYKLVETVKANKNRCRRVSDRVEALVSLVTSFQERKSVQRSDEVQKTLEELVETLKLAQKVIEKYTSANLVKRILKANTHTDKFEDLNNRLNDAYKVLALALHLEEGNAVRIVFDAIKQMHEDMKDGKEDDAELKELLLEHVEDLERELQDVKSGVNKIVDLLDKPKVPYENIRKIKPEELKYIPDFPRKPLTTTLTSEVYKGQYNGNMVAIKRFTEPLITSPRKVESIFNKEVDVMKRLDSQHILRMFGICIQNEETLKPEFFLITEYCKEGSLRDVLSSTCELSWMMKVRMCSHAAIGLYQLHRINEKSRVHGCIDSSKFLVAEGYILKLGGFELTKTETSLKKTTTEKEIRSLCYSSPQILSDINHPYSKECEIYSFGIVLWEIATRKKPFEGWSSEEILNKVGHKEYRYKEPLPPDCPPGLTELVDACRDFDAFQRPSAGVLMDKLHGLVDKLEEALVASVSEA
ncbi:mixed lineage kinase domain-like protein [Cololabis saira]|uniref:mixed lineage kinase domain-like protein n=1 Tax=Cololabis saira TaxID=129043 RepID=UPI002AD57CF5|nr:mixed lineage kinase domain-like protein [Cololabis saira]